MSNGRKEESARPTSRSGFQVLLVYDDGRQVCYESRWHSQKTESMREADFRAWGLP